MLTIFSGQTAKNCDGGSRRDFLRVGALGLTGLGLGQLRAAQAAAASQRIDFVRDKSIILLYLSGGASHIETFDPKLSAPAEIRSMTGEVATPLAGVTFGGTFTRLAKRAEQMAVVRSFQHPIGDHVAAHVHVLTGGTDPTGQGDKGFSMGSCYARVRGTNHPATGLPTNIFIGEQEVDGQYNNERGRALKGSAPGMLGPSYGPLVHETKTADSPKPSRSRKEKKDKNDKKGDAAADLPRKDSLATNMRLNMALDRFDDRRQLLSQLDRLNRDIDSGGALSGVDKFNQQAASLMLGGAADAFDFRKESAALVERYDTSHIKVGHKVFRPSTLGHQLLVARRLCEAGAGFVTVHSAGWDMHADGNNPGILKGMDMLGQSVDIAVSALLDDLADRGLSDKVLLVITGDFGRTPKINNRGGRDHWARLGTLALAGGGLKMGQVIGQSEKNADVPATDPVTPGNLMATIMHTLFDIGQLRLVSGVPREVTSLVEAGQPIRELF